MIIPTMVLRSSLIGLLGSLRAEAMIPAGMPHDYSSGDALAVTAEKMSSSDSPITYDFFYLPFCKPSDTWTSSVEAHKRMNLGQILKGDSFELTAFEPHLMEPIQCQAMCNAPFTADDINNLIELIESRYEVSLSVDDLPAAVVMSFAESDSVKRAFKFDADEYVPETVDDKLHMSGYPLGQLTSETGATVVNHLAMTIYYHHSTQGHYSTREATRVVGFDVAPLSVTSCDDFNSSAKNSLFSITKDTASTIPFSYSVRFVESEIPWITRWDTYLKPSADEAEIHWVSLLDSLVVTLLLGLMCLAVLLRTVRQDIARYNDYEDFDEIESESGWKLLYGDVFRRPWASRALAGFVGSGIQVICAASVVILWAALGILSPAIRGSIGQAAISLFALFGVPAGYVAARLNRVFLSNEVSSARSLITTGITAIIYPGFAFTLFLLANFVIFVNGGASVPTITVIVLGMTWFFVSIPLTIAGAYFGYRAAPIVLPCRVNRLPRQIPEMPKHRSAWLLAGMAGVPIISVAITEFRSIIVSMVFHNFYYLIGYVVVSFLLMLTTAALISVVITYVVLVSEQWRWWWPAFWTGGSTGIYAFLLSMSLLSSVSNGTISDTLINFCYVLIWSSSIGLMLGSVGLLTSFYFVKSIFQSIKID